MDPKTVGIKFDPGKVAQIQCVRNDTLKDLDIKGKCFLFMMIYEGEAKFELGGRVITAQSPCFVCFDESASPRLVKKRGLRCNSIYFHPKFFNINLTFERAHSKDFREAAFAHDLFLMKPFTDRKNHVLPIFGEYISASERIFESLSAELAVQTDGYWSCRSRTYFIQLIFLLERVYGIIGDKAVDTAVDRISDEGLKEAVIFIEGHYSEEIGLQDIAKYASINHTTLTKLFKSELGMTPVEYLWHHRIEVAKKQLQFTLLPIKEVADQCGFKTLQHFSRKFEESTGSTPGDFRKKAFSSRISELDNYQIKYTLDGWRDTYNTYGSDSDEIIDYSRKLFDQTDDPREKELLLADELALARKLAENGIEDRAYEVYSLVATHAGVLGTKNNALSEAYQMLNILEGNGKPKQDVFGFGYSLFLYCAGADEIDPAALSGERLVCSTTPYCGDRSFAFPICESDGVFCDFSTHAHELGGVTFIKEKDRSDGAYFNMPWQLTHDSHRVTIDKDFRDELITAINKAICFSPLRKVYLQIRCQANDEYNIAGMLDAMQISRLVNLDDMLANVVYVIYDPQGRSEHPDDISERE